MALLQLSLLITFILLAKRNLTYYRFVVYTVFLVYPVVFREIYQDSWFFSLSSALMLPLISVYLQEKKNEFLIVGVIQLAFIWATYINDIEKLILFMSPSGFAERLGSIIPRIYILILYLLYGTRRNIAYYSE
jgi:hypothetical protein